MNPSPSLTHRLLRGDLAIIFYMSMARLMLHLVVNLSGGYGLFRDELYYLACADHLSTGYVDHPPFSIYILKMVALIFGDSLFAVRLVPALAGTLTMFITGVMTIRMGGHKFAQFLSCLCSFSFITLAMNSYYSMNSIDILLWTAIAYTILRIVQEQNKNLWIVAGLLLGLGLLNKIGVLFLGTGLFIGLLLTPQRRWLTTPWPYAAGIIAFLIFSPYIIWNVQHDLAHLEFIRNASGSKYASLSPISFAKDQFLMNNPVASLVWLTGLAGFFLHPHLKKYKLLVFLYIVPFIIFVINGTSKGEYLAPGYGILWAAGGICVESLTRIKKYLIAMRIVLCILIAALTIALLPMVLPILPVESYIPYATKMGFKPESAEGKELGILPQFYADMFGWRDKAKSVSDVYNTLSESEKQKCAIFSNNYGRCGAIDYYGRRYGLPKSIGNHNNYWIWGPREYTGEVVIIIGGSYEDQIENFEEVTLVTRSTCQYCMPYENNVNIFLCRKLKVALKDIWNEEKHYE